ncbi:hypothetical protein PK28_00780 [Hymenobacter sp. DG25B]|uniref:hypothetical protein n=1 Tax=Hymenobacter sp. DG25B TaxID=1385664 RepID=UPI000540D877|nr:hypothetical protein [Hymenobacter sp. DG25B]AIZ62582.1 hypothetical protein PK28_00780 [Hymenobacter sp. DG25B]
MKKILLFAPLVLLLATVACKKVDQLLTFYIEDSQNIQISSAFPLGQFVPLSPVSVTTKSEETFKNNKTQADLVKNVSLDKLTLTITDPNSQNFDFLKRIEISISAKDLPEIKLASLDQVPTGVKSIQLVSSGAKLDNYIKAESYTLTTKAEIQKPISQDITVRSDSRFKVTADPL